MKTQTTGTGRPRTRRNPSHSTHYDLHALEQRLFAGTILAATASGVANTTDISNLFPPSTVIGENAAPGVSTCASPETLDKLRRAAMAVALRDWVKSLNAARIVHPTDDQINQFLQDHSSLWGIDPNANSTSGSSLDGGIISTGSTGPVQSAYLPPTHDSPDSPTSTNSISELDDIDASQSSGSAFNSTSSDDLADQGGGGGIAPSRPQPFTPRLLTPQINTPSLSAEPLYITFGSNFDSDPAWHQRISQGTGSATYWSSPDSVKLVEGTSTLTEIQNDVTIPEDPSTLQFDYGNLVFDTSNPHAIKDAFEVALVDARTGKPLVATIG